MSTYTKTIMDYETYISNKEFVLVITIPSVLLTIVYLAFLNYWELLGVNHWILLIFLVVMFVLSFVLKQMNEININVNNLYTKTILKSFSYYTDNANFANDKYVRKMSWVFKLYNQSSNPKINHIILNLDNKIKLLIDEDNKINGFGYVATKACYDVIIEEINKAEQEINEIKNLKSLEITNHFRSVIN